VPLTRSCHSDQAAASARQPRRGERETWANARCGPALESADQQRARRRPLPWLVASAVMVLGTVCVVSAGWDGAGLFIALLLLARLSHMIAFDVGSPTT
jgi:hypothetical protein